MIKFIKSRQSYIIAFTVVAIITGVLFWGQPFEIPEEKDYVPFENGLKSTAAITVRYFVSKEQPFSPVILVAGKSEPDRRVKIRAETSGRVVTINHKKGDFITKGETILRLDMRERQKQLDYAKAMLRQRQLEYNVAVKLHKRDFSTETRLAEAEASLVAAKSSLAQIELDITNTRIKAPFNGILDDIPKEIGDFVSAGDDIAKLIALNPIIFSGNITEKEIPYINKGDSGKAVLISGQEVNGRLRYIAAESDPITRTFRIELAAENPELKIPAGITTELHITASPIQAHRLTPSILAIDDEGHVGVKVLDDNNKVVFTPVEIIFSSAQDTWVRGLPTEARVVTVGQGFVDEGRTITPVLDSSFQSDTTKKP